MCFREMKETSTTASVTFSGRRSRPHAEIHLFERDDARVVQQPVVQEALPDIKRIDAGCAASQQAVGEAARRRATSSATLPDGSTRNRRARRRASRRPRGERPWAGRRRPPALLHGVPHFVHTIPARRPSGQDHSLAFARVSRSPRDELGVERRREPADERGGSDNLLERTGCRRGRGNQDFPSWQIRIARNDVLDVNPHPSRSCGGSVLDETIVDAIRLNRWGCSPCSREVHHCAAEPAPSSSPPR